MSRKEGSVFIRRDVGLLERLNDQAFRLGTSKSSLIRMSVIKFLEEQEKTQQGSFLRKANG
jgi:hypothetical protein